MKRNNKGFSLVELIVAFAILAIAGLSVYGMMSVGGNIFRKTSNDVGLQYEQQIVINQIRDHILESTNAIYYDKSANALYLFDQNLTKTASGAEETKYDITKLTFVGDNTTGSGVTGSGVTESGEAVAASGVIYQNHKEFDVKPTHDEYINDTDLKELGYELGSDIKDISYDLSEIKKNRIKFTITFANQEKEISSTQVVSLRNPIVEARDISDIYSTTIFNKVDSFIQYISVKRADGAEFLNGQADTVELVTLSAGNYAPVSVQYVGIVHAVEASERDYRVNWSVVGTKSGVDGTLFDVPIGDDVASVGKAFDEKGNEVKNGVLLTVKKVPQEDTTLWLVAKSVDEPEHECRICINVTGDGNYPKIAHLNYDNTNIRNENGFVEYTLIPQIYFETIYGTTNSNIVEKDKALPLINWFMTCTNDKGEPVDISKLVGEESGLETKIDPATGKLCLTEEANGLTFKIYFECKQRDKDGNIVRSVETIELTPTNIKPYAAGLRMRLDGEETVNRGRWCSPSVGWQGNVKNKMRYYWKVVPYEDNTSGKWSIPSKEKPFADFDKMVTISVADKINGNISNSFGNLVDGIDKSGWYTSDYYNRIINLNVDTYLDWDEDYKIKVYLFGVSYDNTGELEVFDASGKHSIKTDTYSIQPLEKIITVPKVELLISPATRVIDEHEWENLPTYVKDSTGEETEDLVPLKGKSYRAYNVAFKGIYPRSGSTGQADYYSTSLVFYDVGGAVKEITKNNCRTFMDKMNTNSFTYMFGIDTRLYDDQGNATIYNRSSAPYKMDFQINYAANKTFSYSNGVQLNHSYKVSSEILTYGVKYDY